MRTLIQRWWLRALVLILLLAALIYAFVPRPVAVDMAPVKRGPMAVSVVDEGETRVRDIYVVSAPIAGRVMRFRGDVGDPVTGGETVLACLLPSAPAILDMRTRAELESAVRAAKAAEALAQADLERLQAEVDFARSEYRRAEELADRGTISEAATDRALKELRTAEAAVLTAQAALSQRRYELETARAALIEPETETAAAERLSPPRRCFDVLAPVSGRILQIYQESEAVVAAGAPLISLGDPADLEIVTDYLSTDAVRIDAGDPVRVEQWGGPVALNGTVVRVEPTGFTKISSLGIEEQRVNVVIALTDPPAAWSRLGHGFRVETRVILWQAPDVLQIPISALFRQGEGWAVYRVAQGRAAATKVVPGRMTSDSAQILQGLADGDRVVLHPSDRIAPGVRVTAREIR